MTIPSPDYITESRGGIIENRHLLHAAITNTSGLQYVVGDPTRFTLIRSAAKPAQSVAVIEALASPSPSSTLPRTFQLSGEDIALMSASHSSEPSHLSHALALLERGGNSPSDLRMGGHPAISPGVNETWIRDGVKPQGIHNNCSGKHAGMLAAARALGADPATYHLPDNPVQERVRGVVEDLVGGLGEVKWAVDGCNLPAPAMPLTSLAAMYAAFAAAADEVEAAGLDPLHSFHSHHIQEKGISERTAAMARVFASMNAHPNAVSGEGRFCSTLAIAYPGTVVGKVGADACYGVGIRADPETGRQAMGIAVKVEDGNMDILYAAVPEILERLGLGSAEQRAQLDSFHFIERRNTAGLKVGAVEFPFALREA